jgi:hypothetical protein
MENKEKFQKTLLSSINQAVYSNQTDKPQLNMGENYQGPIVAPDFENVSTIPITLPNNYYWQELDSSNEEQLKNLYNFIRYNSIAFSDGSVNSFSMQLLTFMLNNPKDL